VKAAFVEPMLLLSTEVLPDGAEWLYELKLDGYRALAIKADRIVQLRSRNNNDFNDDYPHIAQALAVLPENTVVDGEVVAFDDSGRPSFNKLQNRATRTSPVFYYVFDVLMLAGRSLIGETLDRRRELLRSKLVPNLPGRFAFRMSCAEPLPILCRQSAAMASRAWSRSDATAPTSQASVQALGGRCESTKVRSS
jgi:ATP-dependent DNA ligase